MVRLKKPREGQVPKLVRQQSQSKSSNRLQVFLLAVIALCVGVTVYVNLTSTSKAIMNMHQYGAAFAQAMDDFKMGGLAMSSNLNFPGNKAQQGMDQLPPGKQLRQPPQDQKIPPKVPPKVPPADEGEDEPDNKVPPPEEDALEEKQHQIQHYPKSAIASLSCERHGGPADEFAQEMVYWSDIVSDSTYVSPLKRKRGESKQYMTFEPDGGGWNNIRMAMETVVGLAAATGRILVLPPQQAMYLLGDGKNKQQKHFGFEDFFPMKQMAAENDALEMITMQEFLETVALAGNLRNKTDGKVSFPPGNRTDWNGIVKKEWDVLREWLREVTLVPQWNPEKCLATFPANGDHSSVQELIEMQQEMHKQGVRHEDFIGKPVAVDAKPYERLKENLRDRRELCIYDEAMQQEFTIHFACAHKLGLRLLVHFYAFLFMEDWREDLWLKRFMRDHMRYNDDIQCAAARLVHQMREIAKKNGDPDGNYDSFHVRRGDFQYKPTRIGADEIVFNTKDVLKPNSTIFIATDERDKSFFEPMRKLYNVYFMDDFKDSLEGVNTNYYGMIDQLVASRGRTFIGCWFSTFTGFINRMRGYHSVKQKLPGYEQGVLPTSYYYVPTNRKFALHEYVPLSGSFFAREFPTSWRDIDKSIGNHPKATD